jgi:hypothetical protein
MRETRGSVDRFEKQDETSREICLQSWSDDPCQGEHTVRVTSHVSRVSPVFARDHTTTDLICLVANPRLTPESGSMDE